VVAANGAVVNDNVPRPESDGVPLLDLEARLLVVAGRGGRLGGFGWGRYVFHFDVGHGDNSSGGESGVCNVHCSLEIMQIRVERDG
jgi:hypothetical protein